MKVLLVTRENDEMYYKGCTRYNLALYGHLKDKILVDVITVSMNESRSWFFKELQALIPFQAALKITPWKMRNYDIVHSTDPFVGALLPLIGKNTVVTFHDLIPLTLKGKWRFEKALQAYHWCVYKLAARSRRIVAISEQTKNELIEILNVNPDIIDVAISGVSDKFKPLPKRERQFTIGFFGNFCYRKRVDLAIEVYRMLLARGLDCRLILAGGKIKEPAKVQFDIDELTKDLSCVTILGFVPEEDIVELYNSFDIMLYPSENEGLGMHIPEALRCGVPVLVRKEAAIPNEVKRACIECSSTNEMADESYRLLTDTTYYKEIRDKALDYAQAFNWENVAINVISSYEKILAIRKR